MKKFTRLLNALIADPRINDAEFRTYAALFSYKFGDENIAFPSQQSIAILRNKTTRTIQNHVQKLKSLGYITPKRRGYSMSNQYTFISEDFFVNDISISEKNFTSNTQESSLKRRNNFRPNNTNDNKTKINNTGEEHNKERQNIEQIRERYAFLRSKERQESEENR